DPGQELATDENPKLRCGYGQSGSNDVHAQSGFRRGFGAWIAELDRRLSPAPAVLASVSVTVTDDGLAAQDSAVCQRIDPRDRFEFVERPCEFPGRVQGGADRNAESRGPLVVGQRTDPDLEALCRPS